MRILTGWMKRRMFVKLSTLCITLCMLGCTQGSADTQQFRKQQHEFINNKLSSGCWISYRFYQEEAVMLDCPNGTSIKVHVPN